VLTRCECGRVVDDGEVGLAEDCSYCCDATGHLPAEELEEQVVLARKVGVERTGGEPGGSRDLLHGGSGEAAFGEHGGGRSQEPVADLGAGRPAGDGDWGCDHEDHPSSDTELRVVSNPSAKVPQR
jgi:hypothetical protein